MFANTAIKAKKDFTTQNDECFRAVCAAAEKGDVSRLEKVLASGIYINIQNGQHTPVSFLAENGNETAVNFLLEHGARLSEATRGYAMGGYHDIVRKIIERELKYAADAMEGYAWVGNEDKVKYWFDRYGMGYNNELYSAPAVGYALGKQTAQLEQFLSGKGNYLAYEAIRGSAYAGDEVTLDSLYRRAPEQDHARHSALIFAAFGGHDKLVEKYLSSEIDATSAAMGYIRLGKADKLEEMIRRGAKVEAAVHYTYYHLEFPRHKHAIQCALRLLSSVSDDEIRKKLGDSMQQYVTDRIDFDLADTAAELRGRMHEKNVDFAQAWEEQRAKSRLRYTF